MRILLLVDCYLPSTKSSAKLVHDLGREFTQQGHDVWIACPDDTLSTPRQICREEGMTILRIRTGAIKGASRFVRGFNEARLSHTFWSAASDVFRANPCDLIVYYSPTIFFGGLVARLKQLWRCRSYLVLRDIFPQWALDAGVMRKGLAYAYFRRAELKQYAAADIIGVQSPANLDYFHYRNQGLTANQHIEVLYNWTTLDEPEVPETHYREAWGLEDQTVFFYGGNIGVAQDMNNILRLACRLQDDTSVHFVIVGDGSEVPRLHREIQRLELENVLLKPAVGQQEYLGMLSEFDVGLMSLDRNLKTQNFPGKMLGYMYHALPLLASINPGNDLGKLVTSHEAGLVCLNGDDDRLAACARKLAEDPFLRKRLGLNGRRLLEEQFTVSRTAAQILEKVGVPAPARRAA